MPKLLQINVALNKGSTGRISEQIGMLVQKKGWDTFILHGSRYVNRSEMYSYQIGTPLQEKFHAVKSMLCDAHGLGSVYGTQKAIEIIKQVTPDVIHLHNIHGYYINYKILFEYLASIETPVVWTLHDCWSITGHCSHFDAIGCDRWKTGCYDCPLKREYPKSLFLDNSRENYLLKKSLFSSVKNMVVVPVSKWLGGIVEQSFMGDYPMKVIYNGVDLETFYPKETDLKNRLGLSSKIILLGVATAWEDRRKGLNDYIKLSKLLLNKYQIILIGISRKLQKNVPNNILCIERTENQHILAEYYSISDVVLNLSYQETFGLTTVEGLACGTPGIVYDKTACPELISKETGKIVEAGNISQLYSAIESITDKGKDFYSSACRKRAEELYNKDDRFMDYVNLYNSLIS